MDDTGVPVERRTVLRGVAVACAAVAGGAALAACGSDEPGAATPTSAGSSAPGSEEPGGGAGGSSKVIVATADVPEGGGIVLPDQEIIVTQPTASKYVAFSSICTHQGKPIDAVENGTINCPWHGSMFAIADGAVVGGPAPSPLPPVEVTVVGDNVVRA